MEIVPKVGRMLVRGVDALSERFDRKRFAARPLCEAPVAPPAEYRRLWDEARGVSYPAIDRYEESCGASIDREWFHDLALVTQVVIKSSKVCYQHGRILYATLARYMREHGRDHLNIVETGTARGFSALCLAKALEDAGATGKITTFDVLRHDVPMFWNCILDAGGPRTRAELLRDYAHLVERYVIFQCGDTGSDLGRTHFGRIHLAFLDSVHSYDHVMHEFGSIRHQQKAGDILVFDDYSADQYPGVVRAADEICRLQEYTPTLIAAHPQRRYLVAEKR